eukprot:NODE_205_length_14851_cov_0.317584.p4 type:complete len:420 gc:universal NODE_205_length_14851_cov_0.317584:8953-7694(-)
MHRSKMVKIGGINLQAILFIACSIMYMNLPKTTLLKYQIIQQVPNKSSFTQEPLESQDFCKSILADRYIKLRDRKYYIAVNLHNNENVLPHLMTSINEFVRFVGPKNVFLSVFESGSLDNTTSILSKYVPFLESKHRIETSPINNILNNTDRNHRIDYLVYIRNKAMNPLYRSVAKIKHYAGHYEDHLSYDSVLFINDIYFCANDLLELEFQRVLNKASISGGMDYVKGMGNNLIFYDSWVALDINGLQFKYAKLDNIYRDVPSRRRGLQQLPLQVSCAWNGMVSLSAKPFLNGYIFRRGSNRNALFKDPGECASSECQTLCLDFIKLGYPRVLMVPRVKVAYTYSNYLSLKSSGIFYDKYPPDGPFKKMENETTPMVNYQLNFNCQPLYDKHRGPRDDNIKYYEQYPEHADPVKVFDE